MEIIEYSSCVKKDKYINQIAACEWEAAKYLATLLRENRLEEALGGWCKLFLLVSKNAIVSFVTLSAQERIADPKLSPWLGFFYIAPEYRNSVFGKYLFDNVCELARKDGHKTLYIATEHIGLCEKSGFSYLENRIDIWGVDSRIYKKEIRYLYYDFLQGNIAREVAGNSAFPMNRFEFYQYGEWKSDYQRSLGLSDAIMDYDFSIWDYEELTEEEAMRRIAEVDKK